MSKKKNLLIITALVLVVAVVAGGVILTNSRKDGQQDIPRQSNPVADQNDADAALLGETFTDSQAGVTMKIPKAWKLTPKDGVSPSSLTGFVLPHPGSDKFIVNGGLSALKTKASMDDVARVYLEKTMDISATTKLVNHQDERIGDKTVRVLAQDVPGANGVIGRLTQYIFYKNGTYYIASYTMLSTDWEAQKPGIEASIRSLKITL